MTTLSLGSGLVNKITKTVFSNGAMYSYTGGFSNMSSYMTAQNIGMGGAGYSSTDTWGNYSSHDYTSYFSLMKGVVPSAISDVDNGERSSDVLVTFTGPSYSHHTNTQTDAAYSSKWGSYLYNGSYMNSANDFLITVTDNTATWSALNLSFTPRYPVASGTPTWFWFRTAGNEHNIIGTVGATGSGSDLELATYEYIDSSKEYTLYNATMATFAMTQSINY